MEEDLSAFIASLRERRITIETRPDGTSRVIPDWGTNKAADIIDDLTAQRDRQRAVIAQCVQALQTAYDFIGAEYSSVEWEARHGEAVAPEARPAWNAISEALAAAAGQEAEDGKG